jgi:hypothetical protein
MTVVAGYVIFALVAVAEYMYAVEAYNDMGSTRSPWNVGRTREGGKLLNTNILVPTFLSQVAYHCHLTSQNFPSDICLLTNS